MLNRFRIDLLLRIISGQLPLGASAQTQRVNCITGAVGSPPSLDPQTSEEVMPLAESGATSLASESTFIELLSAIRDNPGFSERLSIVNDFGQSLLHLAVHLRYHELVQHLVDWGVGLDLQDKNGFTALHCAYLCEDVQIVNLLKQSGANLIHDRLGRLPNELSTCSSAKVSDK
jgi:hypothetical protein